MSIIYSLKSGSYLYRNHWKITTIVICFSQFIEINILVSGIQSNYSKKNIYIYQNDLDNKFSYYSSLHIVTHLLPVMKTFKVDFLNNFQIYDMLLLTIITMLYIISPECIFIITGVLYFLAPSPFNPHIPTLTFANRQSVFCF